MKSARDADTAQVIPRRSPMVKAFAWVGVGAGVTLGALSLAHGPDSTTEVNANSGNAPTNTVFVSPTQGGMNVGATQTWTPPGTSAPKGRAEPPVKATPYG